MLCSICKEKPAVIFVNKKGEDGKNESIGYCMKCAKEHGIDPLEEMKKNNNLTDEELKNMTNALDQMLKGLAINIQAISEDDLEEMMNQENINPDEIGEDSPLGSIFANAFGRRNRVFCLFSRS